MNALILGLPVGLLFGIFLQRGRFCMYTAFRDLLFARDATLFRAYVLALLVQTALIHPLAAAGLLEIRTYALPWLAALLGGFVFGMGITLAGGCSSGTWYRVGEGLVGSWLAVLGYGLSVAAVFWGPLRPWAALLWTYEGPAGWRSLPGLTGLPPGLFLALFVAGGALWLWRSPRPRAFTGWTWARTGLLLGLTAALAWAASAAAGRPFGLSITGPTGAWVRYLTAGDDPGGDWGAWMLLGIPLGAFLAARWSGEFKWRAPEPLRMVKQFLGGLLMGAGAAAAGGCNIGHGLTGVGALSTASLLATLAIMAGTWAGTWLFFMRR